MDREFTAYFDDRVNGLTGERRPLALGPDDVSVVESAVRQAGSYASERGTPLRSDAALFLLMAFHEFVSRPVQLVRPGTSSSELVETITRDVITIVHRAAEMTSDGEISMHSIVNATSASWAELTSARWQLWDGA